MVTYGDIYESGSPIIKNTMTSDVNTFKGYLNFIVPDGGGDTNESGLEGIADTTNGALTYPLRTGAKQFILVTDAPVHDNSNDGDGGDGKSTFDIDNVTANLQSNGIKLTVISNDYTKPQLKRLSDEKQSENMAQSIIDLMSKLKM